MTLPSFCKSALSQLIIKTKKPPKGLQTPLEALMWFLQDFLRHVFFHQDAKVFRLKSFVNKNLQIFLFLAFIGQVEDELEQAPHHSEDGVKIGSGGAIRFSLARCFV